MLDPSYGLWAYSMNHVMTRAFYAQHDAKTPMRIALVMVALNVTLNLALIWPLGADGVRALAGGVETILVIEEKRPFLETAVMTTLYGTNNAPTVIGKHDEHGKK